MKSDLGQCPTPLDRISDLPSHFIDEDVADIVELLGGRGKSCPNLVDFGREALKFWSDLISLLLLLRPLSTLDGKEELSDLSPRREPVQRERPSPSKLPINCGKARMASGNVHTGSNRGMIGPISGRSGLNGRAALGVCCLLQTAWLGTALYSFVIGQHCKLVDVTSRMS